MPSGQDAVVGVASRPPVTMNRWVALVSAMKPRWSSTTASSAPATFASILARIEGSRLLWWIFGSTQSGAGRRTLAVISVTPAASYSLSPSQTASPPWTAESNGLTPARSRWVSLPPTLTTRSRLRSSNACSIGTSHRRDAVLVEAVEVGQALVRQGLEAGGQRGGGRAVRGEAGRGQNAVVPVGRPHPVAVPRAGRPGQHPVV